MLRKLLRLLFPKKPYRPKFSAPLQKNRIKKQSRHIPEPANLPRRLIGRCYVIDGDTIVISGVHIRLAGIDAPELEHPWGKKSKFELIRICKGQTIKAEIIENDSYERTVAKCFLPDGTDIAAELVKRGLALDWKKHSGGEYKHLEPEGVRKKLWRAAARQRGDMRAFNHPTFNDTKKN